MNFRNHKKKEFLFFQGINCLVGANGIGKTNVLDAIHYLSLTKSALTPLDMHSVRHGAEQFSIRGKIFVKNIPSEIICSYALNAKKTISIDRKQKEKISDHIGNYPLVLIAPADNDLISGGNVVRRRLFDRLIAQTDREYLSALIAYTKQLRQRNTLLRLSEGQNIDHDLINIYDQKMISTGTYIYTKRIEFLEIFLPLFTHHHQFLVDEKHEKIAISYRSDYQDRAIATKIKRFLRQDIALRRTNVGIHRDEFVFFLNDSPLKHVGSQGQRKTFLIALKMAEFQYIKDSKGISPILLMDDIFDKLDEKRIEKIIAYIKKNTFKQLFITDAHEHRSRKLFEKHKIDFNVFALERTDHRLL